jgi:hypothetical protein
MNAELRKYPYPYKAMLAICSDLDETPDKRVYFEMCKYLNSTEETDYGPGLGMEVGNSIYFDMPQGQFSYWNTDDSGRNMIHKLIESGHIDCLHSFGDLTKTRERVIENWSVLREQGFDLKVWIDHAQAPTNLDPDIMQGKGALIDSNTYHTDVTISEEGIKYVWKGRVTSIIAQNVKRTYRGLFTIAHPLRSSKTILIEFAKGVLGFIGNKKYAMHAANSIMRDTTLEDGKKVIEFMRTNPSWAGVSVFEKGKDIGEVLTEKFLNVLIEEEGCSILYTHLGKIDNSTDPFGYSGRQAFQMLKENYESGEILVLTTRRLLDYNFAQRSIVFTTENSGDDYIIHIASDGVGADELGGLTWYVENPDKVKIYLRGRQIDNVQINKEDSSGRKSITIPFQRLKLPQYINM